MDELEAMGKRCFGPRKNAAIIEASKAFSKNLCFTVGKRKHGNLLTGGIFQAFKAFLYNNYVARRAEGFIEHNLFQALSPLRKSKRVDKLYCMKGNAGTAQIAENVDVDYMNVSAVKKYVSEHPEIDYIVVAPDDPLAIGLVDELEAMGKSPLSPS